MTHTKQPLWTGHLKIDAQTEVESVLQQLCETFNGSPFFQHNRMSMRVIENQIEGYVEMQPFLVGNVAYQILHGGVAATLLDSVGGVCAMAELYKRMTYQTEDVLHKMSRLATLDLRIDYLIAGKGAYFRAKAEVLRMGKKSCTMRMNLFNSEQILIATAIASYVY